MAIPNLDLIRKPALELLAKRGTLTKISEVFELLAPVFGLNEAELEEMLPSGTQRKWNNRVNWACFDLYRAGMLDRPRKGYYQINQRGIELLPSVPAQLTRTYLAGISQEFEEFVNPRAKSEITPEVLSERPPLSHETPEESIDSAFTVLDQSLRVELLEQLLNVKPFRFEQVVIDLLFAMGYGGSREEAAKVTKKSGDEGIDGVINEDRLGLDVIYVQAKRWRNTVGRPDVQGFVGALAGRQAHKGIFITTSNFSAEASQFAKNIAQKVILIDGPRLAELMIEHDVGVSATRALIIKRIDSDYFSED
jgi:restriction system protein